MKLGDNKLRYNEHSITSNTRLYRTYFFGKIGHFRTQIDPVITITGNNEKYVLSPAVLCNLVSPYFNFCQNLVSTLSFTDSDKGSKMIIYESILNTLEANSII